MYGLRTAICLNCEQEFSGHFSPERKFCNVKCRMEYQNAPDRNPSTSLEARGKISQKMQGKKNSLGRVLSDKTKAKISKALTGRQMPQEHRDKISKTLRLSYEVNGTPPERLELLARIRKSGPESPSWKGGITPLRVKEFQLPEYKIFHKAVMERDNYTCQNCGAKNGNGHNVRFEVHHIKSFAEYPELRYDPDNGIVLCIDCHNLTKRGKRRPRRVDPALTPRTCQHCRKEFRIRNGRKYCPDCKQKIGCPICGSTTCYHSERKALPYYSQLDKLTNNKGSFVIS